MSGAEIICPDVRLLDDTEQDTTERRSFLRLQHLRCDPTENSLPLAGDLERIVLRRTRSADGKKSKGFGQHFEDWGCHLAPGWDGPTGPEYAPVRDSAEGFRHGTVQRNNNNQASPALRTRR